MLAEEGRITSKDVFEALGQGDELAGEVVKSSFLFRVSCSEPF